MLIIVLMTLLQIVNDCNYHFFIDVMSAFHNGEKAASIIDLLEKFRKKTDEGIMRFRKIIPQVRKRNGFLAGASAAPYRQ